MSDSAADIWGDFNLTGNPGSGFKEPIKSKIREWGTDKENRIAAIEAETDGIDARIAAAEADIVANAALAADGNATANTNAQTALDAVNAGLKAASPEVRILVTTATAPASMTAGAVLDGVTLVSGDRVARAYNGATGDAANGVYTVQPSGAAVRATDLDTSTELLRARFSVAAGTSAGQVWAVQNTAAITVGTTAIVIQKTASENALNSEIIAARSSEPTVGARLDKIQQLQRYIQRDLADGLGWSIGMLWADVPTLVGGWWDVSDKTTVFTDVAMTTLALANNDQVRAIADKSGNGNHLIILTTGTPATLKILTDGRRKVIGGAGVSFKTNADKTAKMPTYVAAGLERPAFRSAHLFGVVKTSSDWLGLYDNGGLLGNLRGVIRFGGGSAFTPACNTAVGALNAPMVADCLFKNSYSNLLINGESGNTLAHTYTTQTAVTACYGINMASTTVSSNGELQFYGGVILDGYEPTISTRAKIVAALKKRTVRDY